MIIKIIISLLFAFVFSIRLLFPDLKIDTTSIILLVLATAPWFLQYIKSLEISGIGKVELVSKEKKNEMDENAANAGLRITKSSRDVGKQYSFINLRYSDPKLALAGLRIAIEETLRSIAEEHGIEAQYTGIMQMSKLLVQKQLIDTYENAIVVDITGVLNKAVHSQLSTYDSETFDWVFDLGISLLRSLENKLNT